MFNTSETPDYVVTNSDEQFAIPIDRNAARLLRIAYFCIISVSVAVGLFPFVFFIQLVSGSIFHPPTFGVILLGAIGLGFCFFVFYALALAAIYFLFFRWLFERQVREFNYRVEGKTLRVDWGVFFLKRKAIPLDRVTDFVLVQGPIMRMLGIWALRVQTAGTGTDISEATLIAIENPEKVRDELLRRRDEAARGNRRDYC
jgi:membrane protein YdbS with pleckstrin-like domain